MNSAARTSAGGDRGRQVARRRRAGRRRAGRAGRAARARAGDGPRRRAPARRAARDAGRVGADRDAARLAPRLAAASGISPVAGRLSGSDRLSVRTSPVRSRSTPPLGSASIVATSSRQTGDSVVNDDHTSTSSSSPPSRRTPPVPCAAPRRSAGRSSAAAGRCRWGRSAAGARRCRRDDRQRRRGPRRGTADRRTPRTGRSRAPVAATCRRSSALPCRDRHCRHRPSARGQTSSSSASLRPSAASIDSTWSWVIFSSSFSARSSSSAEISPRLSDALEVLAGVAAQVAHGDPAVLGHVLDDLDVLLAALLGERREREADDRCRRCSG